jgi:hypothetical protein
MNTSYIVTGGIYTDTNWTTLVPGTTEYYGPFNTYQDAVKIWRSRMGWMIDNACHRLFVKESTNA